MSIKNYLLLIVFFLSATITIGSDIKPISANQIPDNSHVLGVDNIKSLYYLDNRGIKKPQKEQLELYIISAS